MADEVTYSEVAAEVYPTVAEVEREVYGRAPVGAPYVPQQRARKQRRVTGSGLLRMSPVDQRLASILGGIPQPRAPRA